ncbi:MAG: DUF21 domain-containing protein, partial [Firmicutes bacterium]|nr:DUF21 domain-containing protein [Bacillota bacterium]
MYIIFIIIGLIVFAGILSAAQTALLSLNIKKFKFSFENGSEKASRLYSALKKLPKMVSALIAGEIICLILSGALSLLFVRPLYYLLLDNAFRQKPLISMLLASAIIIYVFLLLSLLGAKLIPQRIALKKKEAVALSTLKMVYFLRTFFSPCVSPATALANLITRRLGINPSELDFSITEEEIRLMVDAGEETGEIDETEKEMINNIFEFDTKTAEDIATHRTEIVALQADASLSE